MTSSSFPVQCIIKQFLDSFFCDIQNNQDLGKGYQTQPQPSAYNLDHDYKKLLDEVFVISGIIKVEVLSAEAEG